MAQDQAHEAKAKREEAVDRLSIVLIDAVTAFFEGRAKFEVASGGPGVTSLRFRKES